MVSIVVQGEPLDHLLLATFPVLGQLTDSQLKVVRQLLASNTADRGVGSVAGDIPEIILKAIFSFGSNKQIIFEKS
jgi:hypothetical protein